LNKLEFPEKMCNPSKVCICKLCSKRKGVILHILQGDSGLNTHLYLANTHLSCKIHTLTWVKTCLKVCEFGNRRHIENTCCECDLEAMSQSGKQGIDLHERYNAGLSSIFGSTDITLDRKPLGTNAFSASLFNFTTGNGLI
jgi:hypothetical protein